MTLSEDSLSHYTKAFYTRRSRLQKADPRAWSELLPAFPGVVEAMQPLAGRFILAIATSKDRESVNLQLTHYGLTDIFGDEQIVDKDFSESKRDHLSHLRDVFNVDYPSMMFIDDKVLHLISVHDLGIQCFLAGWGFNTARERELASSEGIHVLQIEELEHLK
jgi:phosphoglycolate phosphatase-like HAD superfamily hydrolase